MGVRLKGVFIDLMLHEVLQAPTQAPADFSLADSSLRQPWRRRAQCQIAGSCGTGNWEGPLRVISLNRTCGGRMIVIRGAQVSPLGDVSEASYRYRLYGQIHRPGTSSFPRRASGVESAYSSPVIPGGFMSSGQARGDPARSSASSVPVATGLRRKGQEKLTPLFVT